MPDVPMPLRVAEFEFDPMSESPQRRHRPRPSTDAPATDRMVVQFTTPLSPPERARLRAAYRLSLDDYVPINGYVERISARTLEQLRQEPSFRAAVSYDADLKVATALDTAGDDTDVPVRATAVLFDDSDPATVARELEHAGAEGTVDIVDDRALGGTAHVEFTVDQALIDVASAIDGVRWIEPIVEFKDDNGTTAGTVQSGTPGTTPVWNQGLHGEGQIVGVIDGAALDIGHDWFSDPAHANPDPAHRKVVGLRNTSGAGLGDHGTFVAGIVAGDDVNNLGADANRGNAWAARLTYGNRGDIAGSTSMLQYLAAAAADGAFVHTNSWHQEPTPQYNQTAADVDTFVWNNEDHLVLGSSGNVGESIGPPGTAKNALCVSATRRDPNEMSFGDGNTGPTPDTRGRRKPEIFAPGCNITSADAGTTAGTTTWGGACATSWATPAAAACATLARQYFTEGFYPSGTRQPHHAFTPSGALLKATLLNSTIDMTGMNGYPGNMEGWGLIRLDNVLFFPGNARVLRVWDTHNVDGIVTGETRTHHLDVASGAQALRVTLVWSDPPAAAGAADPIVNDLDLVVTSPDGTQVFRGNVLANGVSTTGGTADDTNNVEMVIVANPAAGDWDIQVVGTAVSVGNPGQGYAVVATADLPAAPLPTGVQDTLVVRVKFSDLAFDPPLANLQNTMLEVADYIDEVSYGQATLTTTFRGPIELDHPRSYYEHPSRNLLIELTEEVVGKLVLAEPTVFDGGTGNAADDIDRIVIVTNDPSFTGDWATTGPWPYDLPGSFTRPLSVSVQSYANPVARFTHGVCHQLGLVDLYAHPGVVFPKAYVDEWDNMAGLFTNVHPLVWSKQRAGWVTGHGSEILYIPRPAAGTSYGGPSPISLFLQESTDTNRKAIAIGLTEGAASYDAESAFYILEARSNTLGGYDDALPSTGVIAYYVNELIPQGEGPVILLDHGSGTAALADAAFAVGDSRTIPGTGISFTVLAGSGGAAFDIDLTYTPPVTDYNVSIVRGDTINGQFIPWHSPDIWVDSPRGGYTLGAGQPPHDQRDEPVAGQLNKLYARIHNAGPGTAFDFDVRFRVSNPYHTVGGDPDFNEFVGIEHIASLPPGDTIISTDWSPVAGDDPHACLIVDLINLVGTDTNAHDNSAQENLNILTSVTQSPFHPVTHRFGLTNPYDEAALFYFRAEGVPKGWTVELTPRKVLLQPGEYMSGSALITPPGRAKACTSHIVQISSWTPRGDTIIPVGGAAVQVDLRKPTAITLEAETGRCDGRDLELLYAELKEQGVEVNPKKLEGRCGKVTAQGCTIPPQPNQEIIVKFIDPQGNAVYHTVMTDDQGCFEDFLVSVENGTWQVEAEYRGDRCNAPARTRGETLCACKHE